LIRVCDGLAAAAGGRLKMKRLTARRGVVVGMPLQRALAFRTMVAGFLLPPARGKKENECAWRATLQGLFLFLSLSVSLSLSAWATRRSADPSEGGLWLGLP